jgi:hypothetical protein
MGFANFLTRTEEVNRVLGSLNSMWMSLVRMTGPLLQLLGGLSVAFGDIVAGILPGLMEGLSALWAVGSGLVTAFVSVWLTIYQKLQPTLLKLWEAIGRLVQSVAQFLAPIIRLLGHGMIRLWEFMSTMIIPVLEVFYTALTKIISFVAELLKVAGEGWQILADQILGPGQETTQTSAMRAMFDGLLEGIEGLGAAEVPVYGPTMAQLGADGGGALGLQNDVPGRRGGARVTQDFRYSRFQIQQEFAEGFDPDRIAVAFAQDLQRVGERQLQSGFEPIGGTI